MKNFLTVGLMLLWLPANTQTSKAITINKQQLKDKVAGPGRQSA
jgi:hypothetical protein